MADQLQFRGGTTSEVSAASVASREIIIDTQTNEIAVGTSKKRTVMQDSNGNVGIGTTSPTTPLEIASSGTTNALISAFDATASRAYYQVGGTTSGRYTQIGTDTSTTFINDYFGTGIAFQLAASEKARIDSSGRLLVGTSSDSGGARLQVNDNRIRIATAKTPASASDTGTAGEICWDADYIYVCTATDTWKRTTISTW
jgi:hypothetical protein